VRRIREVVALDHHGGAPVDVVVSEDEAEESLFGQ
jgi:hypothetical protein